VDRSYLRDASLLKRDLQLSKPRREAEEDDEYKVNIREIDKNACNGNERG
jgi:hypothetical protein